MSKEPLLPISGGGASLPPHLHRILTSSISSSNLPEHDDLPLPNSPSSFKHRLIFGPSPASSSPSVAASITVAPAASDTTVSPASDDTTVAPASADTLSSHPTRHHLHRSHTVPARPITKTLNPPDRRRRQQSSPFIRYSFLLLSIYLSLGVLMYSLRPSDFESSATHPVVDAFYFCIVTMCTIGYGDITPTSPAAKLFSIAFVLLGFGFIDILLSVMVSYILDLQERYLLHAAERRAGGNKSSPTTYFVDLKKGRMRIRLKVGIALGVVVLCIVAGALFLRWFEMLSWLDAFYLSVMSVTTVGYGDKAFTTMGGRLFASGWLLISTLAVARAFLYLTEARLEKRQRKMAKWVLARDLTVSEFHEADIDNNGFVSKSEFAVYKLKEMGMIAENDIVQIYDQFDRLDSGNSGKISLFDLVENSSK